MDWAVDMAMNEKSYSQRWACARAGIDPRVYRGRPTRPEDRELRQRLRELSGERRRFGYRRLQILLKREGWVVNWKKLYRIYCEEGLTVRKHGGRKRAIGTRAPMAIPQGPNQRWSLDFVSDTLSDGRRLRILCVIDDFSRECLTTVVDTSLSGIRVAHELDRIAELRGYPSIVQASRRAWQEAIPFFAFGPEIRRVIYTTNAVDSLNRVIRKSIKTRGSFPSEEAAEKLIYLAIRGYEITARTVRGWLTAVNQFPKMFADRFTPVAG